MDAKLVAVIAWVAGVASTACTLLLKAHLQARQEQRRAKRESNDEAQKRRLATDRATYTRRLTILVQQHLATYVRSGGRWWSSEEDLQSLVSSLERGAYEHFLDPAVDQRWIMLVEKTVELARKRTAGRISDGDIQRYNDLRRDWEVAAKQSFGPLPETSDLCQPRRDPGEGAPRRGAAA